MSGFFKSLEKGIKNAAGDLSREVGHISRDVNRSVDGVWSSAILDTFKMGNVVQLVSRSSGRCLQIVMSPVNTLVVDGMGPEGPAVYHAHWTILNEGKNVIRIHNNNNYLAVVNGATVLGNFPPPAAPGPETRFQLSQTGNFVRLMSMTEPGRHVGVLADGTLKSALATGPEENAQFGVRLVYSPHGTVVASSGAAAVPPPKK